MWPMYVDYTDDECKRLLRSLELEAYAAIISAFRAQGCLTKDKRKILQDLCSTLSISVERHRAEIRRAVNDEHLNTVAERLYGANTSSEWAIEGRRVVPLMQRLAPQTVFTDIANSAANAQATKNASLPLPGKTGLREISNGVETMASRKRKELPSDVYMSPNKLQAVDSQYLSSVTPYDTHSTQSGETLHVSEPPPTSEISAASEAPIPEPSSLSDYISSKIPPMAHVPSLVSPVKSTTKHIVVKSSTVTTFSSFDQLTTNLLSSKPASRSPLQALGPESHQVSVSEALKSLEPKSLQRSSSTGAMRTTVIPHTIPSTGTSSSSNDRPPSSTTSQSKFVSQLRSKPAVQGRQNLPSGLGVKLNIQPQMSRSVSPKTSGSKPKQDANSGFLTKKSTTGVFSPTSQPETIPPHFSVNESLTITKTPPPVPKSPAKSESQTSTSHPSPSKVPVTKSLPKVSTSSSQYISRSLFGSGTKGAKSLPPVIFNVSSSATLQTPTKTTAPVQSEACKTSSSQLLPKSTAIGVSQSHMKLGSSTTQTIQYRNDGGLVRSARIINVTPPAGSRLPCSITPSAISALGLSSNLSSGALRVTLPAGTLNTSSAMRASAVAKPNVIVVHKAQMWPRSQGAAVIMSSTPVQRMPDSNLENTQKQEKNKPSTITTSSSSTTKLPSRPLSSPRPQSPVVSIPTMKITDTGALFTQSPNPAQQTDNSSVKDHPLPTSKNSPLTQSSSKHQTSTTSSKNQTSGTGMKNQVNSAPASQKTSENPSDAQCKKNLLADVIEASGIVLESADKSALKEKAGEATKKEKVDIKATQKNAPISTTESLSKGTSDVIPTPKLATTSVTKTSTPVTKPMDNVSADTMSDASKESQNLKRQEKMGDKTNESSENATISTAEISNKTISKKQAEDSKNL